MLSMFWWLSMGLKKTKNRLLWFSSKFSSCVFPCWISKQSYSPSLPPAILCLFLSLMREWWWHVLGDGDRVPNQTSYEAVSPLLISCPHHCLASFVLLSTQTHIQQQRAWMVTFHHLPLQCLSLHVHTYSHTNVSYQRNQWWRTNLFRSLSPRNSVHMFNLH